MFKRFDIKAPKGVNFTREPSQLDPTVWDEAEEVAFRHGMTKKVNGWSEGLGLVPDGSGSPVAITSRSEDGGLTTVWTYATSGDKIYRADSTATHTDVTPDTIIPSTGMSWTCDSINSNAFYGKGHYYPWISTKFQAAHYFPNHVKGRVFRTYKNHIICMNFDTTDFDPSNPGADWCSGITDDAARKAYAAKFGSWSGELKNSSALWWSDEVVGASMDVSWADADPTSESGWNFLGGSGGAIKEGKSLRDSFIIYRESSVWQMSYIGGVQVFAFKELFNDNGILGLNCVTDIGGKHFVIAQSDVYIHNGVQKNTIVDGIIRDEIFNSIDPTHVDKVYVSTRYADKEAWICIPESGTNVEGQCNVAFVYNWEEDTWAKRSMPDSRCSAWGSLNIAAQDESWNSPKALVESWSESDDTWTSSGTAFSVANMGMVFGGMGSLHNVPYTPIPMLFTATQDSKFNGKNFVATVEKKWLDMGNYSSYKTLNKIYPLVRNGVIKVYVAGSRTVLEAPKWKYAGTYDPDSGRMHIAAVTTGRFIHIRFEIPEESRAEIKGYTIEYKESGER